MLKKILILLLTLAMLSTLLVGCKKKTNTEVPKDTETETTEEDDWVLPALDYGNKEIVIHVRGDDDPVKEIGIEDDGTALSSELYERTMATEERLNVVITISKQNSWSAYSATIRELRSSIQNGLGTYDLVAGWSPRVPVLASEGLFYNLNQFDYFDGSQEWWSQSLTKALTFNGKLYMATGDISSSYMDGALVAIFNQPLALSLGYDYSTFYDVVTANEWTIDYLYTLTKDVYNDKNGSDSRDDGDVYGLLFKESYNLQCFWASSGINIVSNNGVDRPELNFDVEKIQNVYNKVYNLIYNNPGALLNTSEPILDDPIEHFKQGGALFMIQTLGTLSQLTDMEDEYGILPVPKYNEQQEQYYSHLHACTMWSIPMDASDPEMSSAIMTSLAYDSNKLVIEPHYEKLLKLRYVKDSESGYMIDLIYDNIYMNFDSIYNEALGVSLSDKTTMPIFVFATLISQNNGSSVASWWQTNKTSIQTQFDSIMDGFFEE